MATQDELNRKYAPNPFAAALMAAGDSISGIYGQRGNTYATYIDAQQKRMAMEIEAQKYADTLAQQSFENQMKSSDLSLKLQNATTAEKKMMIEQGYIPMTSSYAQGIGRSQGPQALRKLIANTAKDAYGRRYQQPLTIQEQLAQFTNGDTPVGATVRVKAPGGTSMYVPLNPKLTEDEKAAVSGTQKFSELAKEVTGYIDKGTVSGNIWKQFLAEHGENPLARIATKDDSDLEKLSSARAEMIKYVFSEGGKQLTNTEKGIVSAGLDFTGKSDKQIKKDFNRAIDLLKNKGLLTIGGRKEANKQLSSVDFSKMSDDELRELANS